MPTLEQVQTVIDTVNSQNVLSQVLEESASPGGQLEDGEVVITIPMLGLINGIESLGNANLAWYQQAINQEAGFSNPPTLAEVQALIDRVNEEVAANQFVLAQVLHSSVSEGSNGEGEPVTAEQLLFVRGLIGVEPENEASYQSAINAEANFSEPPTVAQVQALIDRINHSEASKQAILAASLSDGGGRGVDPITMEQLGLIEGLERLDSTNEAAYHAAIATEANFDNPPTLMQIQALIDRVNASESALMEILFESSTLGGSGEGNISIAQLNAIDGLVGVEPANVSLYQSAIGIKDDFSNPPTLEEVQHLIHSHNDEDEDGISDALELGFDSDGDGVADNIDIDSDNDTISDELEGAVDTDNDGVPDFRDLDTDNDGIRDNVERLQQTQSLFSADSNRSTNTLNASFNDVIAGADIDVIDEPLADSDNDGVPDFRDLDADNDGIPDVSEAGFADINLDGLMDGVDREDLVIGLSQLGEGPAVDEHGLAEEASTDPLDSDRDGIPDFRDLDSDNDSLTDISESFGPSLDTDGNGQLDDFIDTDNDGVSDTLILDPTVDVDVDQDGQMNHVDTDSDADGLSDLLENGGQDENHDGRIDTMQDLDSDGMDDSVALFPVEQTDSDLDGMPDYKDPDSDNDGVSDLIQSGGMDLDGDGQAEALTENPASAVDTPDPIEVIDPNEGSELGEATPEVVVVGQGSSSGCSIGTVGSLPKKTDPLLPGLILVALAWLLISRRSASSTIDYTI